MKPGDRVRIIGLHIDDAYYGAEAEYQLIGTEGTVLDSSPPNQYVEGAWSIDFERDEPLYIDGVPSYKHAFYAVQVELI